MPECGKPWRRRLAWALVVTVCAAAAVAAEVYREVHTTRLVTETTVTDKLTGELRIMQLSDIHMRDDPAQLASIVAQVRDAGPHLIVIAGDTLNTRNETLDPLKEPFSRLAELGIPMYAVLGNHDHWSRDLPQLVELYARHGIKLIDNEHEMITGEFGSFTLVGAGDAYTDHAHLDQALKGAPGGFRFLLTHSPEILPQLEKADIDYAVCGHTHGGQVAMPFIGAIHVPGQGLFPKYSRGRYQVGKAALYIDSGVGVTGMDLRFLVQSQIVLHVFHP
ncbi:metallophosphoesterase [Arachnia propionica]|uniref:metallophosphoesterase n=1 Tax=Arachnia propionica TaxID=1750 RepID=UPI00242A5414|nr:metallophosphoesterase [Arachnia propionica]